jgi:hypothetical protein
MTKTNPIVSALAIVLIAGCHGPEPESRGNASPKTSDSAATSESQAPSRDAQVNMTGSMTLRLFEPDLEGGETREASFEISSPQCSLLEDGLWALTSATAIIYGADGEQTKFEAGRAEFNEKADTASLRDGVTVDFGRQHVELQDMTWSNVESLARSDSPLTLTDGGTKLSSEGMEYHANSKVLLLKGVTGTVSMQQGDAPS